MWCRGWLSLIVVLVLPHLAGAEPIPAGSLAILTEHLPDAAEGQLYQAQIRVDGGQDGYLWTLEGEVPGLELVDGHLVGTAAEPGTWPFDVRVRSGDEEVVASLELFVHAAPPLRIVTGEPEGGGDGDGEPAAGGAGGSDPADGGAGAPGGDEPGQDPNDPGDGGGCAGAGGAPTILGLALCLAFVCRRSRSSGAV